MWARFSAAARAARRTSLHTTAGVLGAAGFACGASLLALPHVAAASAPAPLASAAAPLPPPLQAPPPIQDVIASAMPSLVKISGETVDAISGRVVAQGAGSGFVFDASGLVATNDHVFEALRLSGARSVLATFDDGRVYRVQPLASDKEADVAVGKLLAPPGTPFQPLPLGSSSTLRRGDTVIVLGAPLGGSLVPTVGVVSGQRYVADDELMGQSVLNSRPDWLLLQLDAAMASGNSGGPILDAASGKVVGISVMVQTAGSSGVGNVNFGVASEQVGPVLHQLTKLGAVTRARVGMTIAAVDALADERQRAAGGPPLLPPGHHTGLLVTDVQRGSPAEASGLRPGDVLLSINGRVMRRKGDYFAALGPVWDPKHRLEVEAYRPSAAGEVKAQIRPLPREEGKVRFQRRG